MLDEYTDRCIEYINDDSCAYYNIDGSLVIPTFIEQMNCYLEEEEDDCTCHTGTTESSTLIESNDDDSIDTSLSTAENAHEHPFQIDMLEDMDIYDMYPGEPEVIYSVPVPKTEAHKGSALTPISICVTSTIGLLPTQQLFRVLFDSGSTATMINRKCLPTGCNTQSLSTAKNCVTLGGTFQTKERVILRGIKLPEFDKARRIDSQNALVFDGKSRYDIIFGADFLTKIGMKIDYANKSMDWFENSIAMREPFNLKKEDYLQMADSLEIQADDEFFGDDYLDSYLAAPIMDAKYEKLDIDATIANQKHLTDSQRADLKKLFEKHKKLFDGTLGVYPHKKFSIELEKDAKPVHARPYAVPRIHMEVFKKELDHLVKLGVLSKTGASEWASPTFIVPKKDGRVRWISDLRQLNKVVKRRTYPLPVIMDVLRKRKGFKFFSKLDISMQYYTFELTEEAKDLCTIVTPFGKYRYERLPMGLKCSPDYAQEEMERIFCDMRDDADVYIDDVGAFSNSWEHHVQLLDKILARLKENGFTVNPLKCEWGVTETDWLGYWLTPVGLKPWKKKIDAILKLHRPKTLKQLRGFIGAVNYYRDMWPGRSHILSPLTAESGTKKDAKGRKITKMKWTPEMQKAFDKMKALLTTDAISFYPDHNKTFHIYTDASNYQMGAVIMQKHDGKLRPCAYYSKKFNKAQARYTTTEQELLSIYATLKEFRSMLLGADIVIHTDHRNLTFDNLTTQRVLRWRVYLEEFSPVIEYIKGPDNHIADTLSRLHRTDESYDTEGKKSVVTFEDLTNSATVHKQPASYHSLLDDLEIAECVLALDDVESYLNIPGIPRTESPLNYEHIKAKQLEDADLQALAVKYPNRYIKRSINGVPDVLTHTKEGEDTNNMWKIALPKSLLKKAVDWFHEMTGHSGQRRLRDTMSARYYHPQLRKTIDSFKCEDCQKHKLAGKGHGELPERELKSEPFAEVAVDLVGPWKVKARGKIYEFNALTIIDPVTNLVELVSIRRKTSDEIKRRFSQTWLARYPWPQRCIHDNGGEFTGWEFQELLSQANIQDVPTTSYNPTANAVCERMHQTMGNVLRTLMHGRRPPQNLAEAKDIMDEALSIVQHALRCTVHTTLGSSPGALVFNRDMFLNLPLQADWEAITTRREHVINENLRRQNLKRRRYDYVIGQKVLKKMHDPTKLGERTVGPYEIKQVHVNGTLTIELTQGVTERINIRRVQPYVPES